MPLQTYIRAVLTGPVSSQDTWSTGIVLNFGNSIPAGTPSEMNTIASTILNNFYDNTWNASSNSLKARNAPATELSTCNVYQYVNGLLVAQGTHSFASSVAGTGTSLSPAYTSIVVSLLTQTAGRSGRGRMYLPATAWGMDSSTLQFGSVTSVGPTILAFYTNLVDDYVIDGVASLGVPAVLSRVQDQVHEVTSIRVDSIPDTQRGRKNKDVSIATYSGNISS